MRSTRPTRRPRAEPGCRKDNMRSYKSIRQQWEEAADPCGLFADLPEVFRQETQENHKEHYQELQELLSGIAAQVEAWDFSDPERFFDLCAYLLMLARVVPEIDEEVFDHKMNVVRQYRRTLKALLCVPWAREAATLPESAPLPPCLSSLPESKGREALSRLRESIGLCCENRVLLAEKYASFLEGGPHEV